MLIEPRNHPLLQAGSLIVENLRTYGQPVLVYLPPGAELRGGAWVVIDAQINPSQVPCLTTHRALQPALASSSNASRLGNVVVAAAHSHTGASHDGVPCVSMIDVACVRIVLVWLRFLSAIASCSCSAV